MEYVTALVEEATRYNEEWCKCLKRYGSRDKRTLEAYYKYLGMEKAREIALEIMENKEEQAEVKRRESR